MGGRAARPCWRMGVGGGESYLHERDQPAAAVTKAPPRAFAGVVSARPGRRLLPKIDNSLTRTSSARRRARARRRPCPSAAG